jgi:FeS assembly protein IscX
MPPKLTWLDSEEIAIQLHEKFPDLDPLTVRFTDLHQWVCELPGFSDDPKASSERKLEAIQMAWLEEWRDAHTGDE